jgi:hypothetical protein
MTPGDMLAYGRGSRESRQGRSGVNIPQHYEWAVLRLLVESTTSPSKVVAELDIKFYANR